MKSLAVFLVLLGSIGAPAAGAQEPHDVALPAPRMEGGMPLMQALKARHSTREFDSRALDPQVLADLLWAADGINRADSGKRTAPSARNWQEVEIYVIEANAAYLYNAKDNVLKQVATGDLRKLAGVQDFVSSAPLNLVYVADAAAMQGASPEDQRLYEGADTGFIAQNVYLFCASAGLNVVVRASVDRKGMAAALKLPPEKSITLAQTIGYPPGTGK